MANSVSRFYDGLADQYHLLFADWDAAVQRQGVVLDRLIVPHVGPPPHRVLDASCGIGTQALGLAGRGYAVHGTDISAVALDRAEREAARLGVPLTTQVADLRSLQAVAGTYDVVLSCDNALPHLLTDDELAWAAAGMYAKLRPGGLLVASIRDYDALLREKPRADLPRVFDRTTGRQIAFQVWDWAAGAPSDAQMYTIHQFVVQERDIAGAAEPGEAVAWTTHHESTVYRALQRADLTRIMEDVGFQHIIWHSPETTGYYQPILTARRILE
jgi:glycine/sarcosine N-methyltransferase